MKSRKVGVLAGLALAIGAVGCGSSSNPAVEAEVPAGHPIAIGYLASQTGFCSRYAREYVAGAELAAKRIDATGGVDGHSVELIVRDDWDTPSVGLARARELVVNDHVKYLAGTCSAAVGKSVAQLVANPDHVVYVLGISDASTFAGGPSIYAFDTIPTATVEARAAAAYMRAHPRWRRIAVISEGYGYGYQITASFRRALAGSGQTIVSEQYVPPRGADYRPYITQALARHPDAIYSSVVAEDAVTLIKQGLGLGLFDRDHFFGVMDYGMLAQMSRAPVGAVGYTIYPSASIYGTPFARALDALGPPIADGGAAGDGFNQIEIVAQGIAMARSTDPTRVRDALAGATVQTVQGAVKVDACDHEIVTPIATGFVSAPSPGTPFPHFDHVLLIGAADNRPATSCR